MATIRGTDGWDRLSGTDDDDQIIGRGGNDIIDGGAGRDRINGGDGDDTLRGDAGDDVLIGGEGNDWFYDSAGSAVIDGGTGRDMVSLRRTVPAATDTFAIDVGSENDTVYFGSLGGGNADISLGDGEDRISLSGFATGTTTITTGLGSDTLSFDHDYALTARAPVVADFMTGQGGDRLNVIDLLGWQAHNWNGSRNPFERGFLRLVQDGSDTLLQIDTDGHRRRHDFVTLVVLKDVDASTLTRANLFGFAPNGSPAARTRTLGTDAGDVLDGTVGADRIDGGLGDDTLRGDVGNDRLWGGAGNDMLRGGAGDDQLFGGDGNDAISEDGGSNHIDGGAGDDYILHQLVSGGTSGGGGTSTIIAGAGNDYVRFQNNRGGMLTLDLGSGDDLLDLYTVQEGGAAITTGLGRDTIAVRWDGRDHFRGVMTVTDFAAGGAGDRLVLREFLSSALIGWTGDDPFAGGFLRLTDADGATLIEVDRDGHADAYSFATLARLNGVASADLIPGILDMLATTAAALPITGVLADWADPHRLVAHLV